MQKIFLGFLTAFMLQYNIYAQAVVDSTKMKIDAIEKSLEYKTGTIELETGNALVNIPPGFRYLDKEEAKYVLSTLWGNPDDDSLLGMIVPEGKGVLDPNIWVFTISFDEMGYVKDEDADDFDYDDLLKEQQKEIREANPERVKAGYSSLELIGWASAPFYDKEKKVLHWAKEVKFDQDSINTLNYNLRILGRKGIFLVNAISNMDALPEIKSNIDKIIGSVQFKEGHRYSEYIPDVDSVAKWTIGGLVAGKILTKVGLLVVLAKFWKLIAVAVVAGFSAFMNFIRGRRNKKENEEQIAASQPTSPPANHSPSEEV